MAAPEAIHDALLEAKKELDAAGSGTPDTVKQTLIHDDNLLHQQRQQLLPSWNDLVAALPDPNDRRSLTEALERLSREHLDLRDVFDRLEDDRAVAKEKRRLFDSDLIGCLQGVAEVNEEKLIQLARDKQELHDILFNLRLGPANDYSKGWDRLIESEGTFFQWLKAEADSIRDASPELYEWALRYRDISETRSSWLRDYHERYDATPEDGQDEGTADELDRLYEEWRADAMAALTATAGMQ